MPGHLEEKGDTQETPAYLREVLQVERLTLAQFAYEISDRHPLLR